MWFSRVGIRKELARTLEDELCDRDRDEERRKNNGTSKYYFLKAPTGVVERASFSAEDAREPSRALLEKDEYNKS